MLEKIKHAMQDLQAMTDLLREVEPYVYRVCYYLTGHQQDAEDLAQESMIKISRSLHTFRADSSLQTWMYQLILNTHRDKQRVKKNRMQVVELSETSKTTEGFENHVTMKMLVNALLRDMTAVDRSIFTLRFLQDLPIKDVAEQLGMNESTVKTRMMRLREKLKSSPISMGGELG